MVSTLAVEWIEIAFLRFNAFSMSLGLHPRGGVD